MFGFVLVLIDGLRGLFRPKLLTPVLLFIVLLLSFMTWQRNALWKDPVAFYEDNLLRAPQSERVRLALSHFYMNVGRDEDALKILQQAIDLNAKYVDVYVSLSKIYFERGLLDEAMTALQKGLAVAPTSKKLLDNIGTLYDELGQPELAIQYLRRSIAVAPNYPNSHLNLGVVYAGLEQWSEAIAFYQKAVALSHEYPVAHYNLGVAYYYQNNLAVALRHFRIAVEQDPGDAMALFNMTSIALKLGDKDAAVGALQKLRVLDSKMAMELESEIANMGNKPQ
jgi:tetratricopeptide (TPR) repeat protein